MLISSYNVCFGVESSSQTSKPVSHIVLTNSLQHKQCKLLLSNKSRCDKCASVKRNVDEKRKKFEENQDELSKQNEKDMESLMEKLNVHMH